MKKLFYSLVVVFLLCSIGCLDFPEPIEIAGPFYGAGVTDIDGNTYQTVIIGDQEWMAEELRVTHFPDGSSIQYLQDSVSWVSQNRKNGGYCTYNSVENGDHYLYNWWAAVGPDTAMVGDSILQGACPDGWHLPDVEEWNELKVSVGIIAGQAGYQETIYQFTLMAIENNWPDKELYHSNLQNLENKTGFNLIPINSRYKNIYQIGPYVYFWTSLKCDSVNTKVVNYDGMHNGPVYPRIILLNKLYIGHSVRCVKN